MKQQMKTISIENLLISSPKSNIKRSPIHNNNVRTHRIKSTHKKTPAHTQIRQTEHKPSPMLTKKPLNSLLNQLKNVSQIVALIQLRPKELQRTASLPRR